MLNEETLSWSANSSEHCCLSSEHICASLLSAVLNSQQQYDFGVK